MELTSEQIQILLVEKLAGTIDEKDNLFIEQLLATDEQVKSLWTELLTQLQQIGGLPKEVDEEQAWQKVESLLSAAPPRRIPFLRLAGAAAALVAVGLLGFLLFSPKKGPPVAKAKPFNEKPSITLLMENGLRIALRDTQVLQVGTLRIQVDDQQMKLPLGKTTSTQWSTLEVPPAFNYKITLSDGSEVWLNAQSSLRFPLSFQEARREVYVQGEAYFKVSKDHQHPFIVHTPETEIQVVGTQFNVNAYHDCKVETALVEGAVITRDMKGSAVAIKPGVEAVYRAKHGFSTRPFDETEVLSWMKGVYYFHNTSLKNLALVLSRCYGVAVYFENSDLKNKTFSGKLMKGQELHSFLENLNLALDLHAFKSEGMVVFR